MKTSLKRADSGLMPRRLTVDAGEPDPERLAEAVRVIRAGGVIAWPTEHYYALACDPENRQAVARLYELKGRPPEKPLLVGISDRARLGGLTGPVPEAARALVSSWPHGLTLLFSAIPEVPRSLLAGGNTLGVRLMHTPVARALIDLAGGMLPATSANRSGQVATGDPDQVMEQLPELDLIVDAGVLPEGRLSTILDISVTPWRIVREGALGRDALAPFGEIAPD